MDQRFPLDLGPMTPHEKATFNAMDTRIAAARKVLGLTQVQLAETRSSLQQTVASRKVGRRGVPVSVLPLLARSLGVAVEAFIAESERLANKHKRGPTPSCSSKSSASVACRGPSSAS